VGSLVCAGATLANAMVTDYPGGVFQLIDYNTHGRNDAAIAGLTATLPSLLRFNGKPEAWYFDIEALAETTVLGLTDFDYYKDKKAIAA